ncbi:uncharacterized protein [Littorina saxatilis]|uniref:uncharacterized protein isoform X2 n=1 Tax=Littorina saxatilis TaxID=31220 RepID=UPI0038B5A513
MVLSRTVCFAGPVSKSPHHKRIITHAAGFPWRRTSGGEEATGGGGETSEGLESAKTHVVDSSICGLALPTALEEKKRQEAAERRQGLKAAKTHVVDSPICGLALPTALEEKKRQEAAERRQGLKAAKTHVVDSPICGLALPTALEEKKRQEAAERRQGLKAAKTNVVDSPICGLALPTALSRKNHLKKCASNLDVETDQLLSAVKRQEEKHSTDAPADLARRVMDQSPTTTSRMTRLKNPESDDLADEEDYETMSMVESSSSEWLPSDPDTHDSDCYVSDSESILHALEPEVSAILKMGKGHPDRRKAFIKLQDEGDYHYNCKVLRDKEGPLIPKYRKSIEPTTQPDYVGHVLTAKLFIADSSCPNMNQTAHKDLVIQNA